MRRCERRNQKFRLRDHRLTGVARSGNVSASGFDGEVFSYLKSTLHGVVFQEIGFTRPPIPWRADVRLSGCDGRCALEVATLTAAGTIDICSLFRYLGRSGIDASRIRSFSQKQQR